MHLKTSPLKGFLILGLIILALSVPSIAPAAPEQRTALVIGNGGYSSSPLKNPVNDATALAAQLQKLGFAVILKKNANLRGMEDALTEFGDRLKKGGVGLFFYAGHGLQVGGVNYLVPVGAKVNRESDIKYETLDAGKVLDEMANANNGLNIVILDACRDNPYSRSFRNASRGLAVVSNAPVGTFISYSTGPGNVARDGDGQNSPYTEALLRYMKEPGLSIEQVFKGVRTKLGKETGGKQIPWELSSLQGDFYFTSRGSRQDSLPDTTPPESEELVRQKAALDQERQELAREKQDLERQKTLDAEREQLAAERRKIEAEKQQLAMAKRPSVSTAGETDRNSRFIAKNNTVLDTKTNLMWAAKDNGSDISWADAKSYCKNYRGGGYKDWRMPTQDELAGLYDKGTGYTPVCAATGVNAKIHLTNLIILSCWWAWASETRGSSAAYFDFYSDGRYQDNMAYVRNGRALPVRSAK